MKLETFNQDVLSTGTDSSDFSMQMNGTAFSIMSDNLYQYKIAAMVRELTCNAADSHIEAGKGDVPIKVIFPNSLHPNFTIEDFGLGLNDEQFRKIFAGYFTSTKQQTDDLTGGFGLGSKCAFSYTKSFSVRCRSEGKEISYTCMVGEDRIPKVLKLHETTTTECNGVKITIPVRENDFRKFRMEASVIYSFLSVPVHVEDETFELVNDKVQDQIKNNGVATLPRMTNSDLYSHSYIYALMGGVLYPLHNNYSEVEGFNVAFGSSHACVIPFEVGELCPAASRESLSMDESTKEKVHNRISEIIHTALKETQDKINSCMNVFDAFSVICGDTTAPRRDQYHVQSSIQYFKFKGKRLAEYRMKRLDLPEGYGVGMFRINRRADRVCCSNLNFPVRYNDVGMFPDLYGHTRTKQIYAFYIDDGTKSSFVSKCRLYARTFFSEGDMALTLKKELSDAQRERLSSLFNGKLSWIKFSDVKQAMKSSPKVRQERSLTEKQDTTVYAKQWVESGGAIAADNVDVSSDESLFFSVEKVERGEEAVCTGYDVFDASALCALLRFHFNKKVVLLGKNSSNEKKMDRLGVTPLTDDGVADIVKKNKDLIQYCVVTGSYAKKTEEGKVRLFDSNLDTMDRLTDVKDVAVLKEKLEKVILDPRFDGTRIHNLYKIKEEFKKGMKFSLLDEYDSLCAKYSMISSGHWINVGGNLTARSHVMAKMVAFCEENGYTVEQIIKES